MQNNTSLTFGDVINNWRQGKSFNTDIQKLIGNPGEIKTSLKSLVNIPEFDNNFSGTCKFFSQNGKLHNTEGPAKIVKSKDGKIDKEYRVDGEKFDAESFLNQIKENLGLNEKKPTETICKLKNGKIHSDTEMAIVNKKGNKFLNGEFWQNGEQKEPKDFLKNAALNNDKLKSFAGKNGMDKEKLEKAIDLMAKKNPKIWLAKKTYDVVKYVGQEIKKQSEEKDRSLLEDVSTAPKSR